MSVENVDLAEEAVRLAERLEQEVPDDAERMPLTPPAPSEVLLPFGLWSPLTGVTDRAEVRELNGFDEEAIARSKTPGLALLAILERATVRIGDERATPKMLDELTIGDRLELLLGIRAMTWGDEFSDVVQCPRCEQEQDVSISLSEDIPRNVPDNKEYERTMSLSLPSGREAVMRYPTGVVHKKVMNGTITNIAEMTTELIVECVESLTDVPFINRQAANSLSLRDRQAIYTRLSDDAPGPQLSNVKKPCSSCGEDMVLPLSVGALFPVG